MYAIYIQTKEKRACGGAEATQAKKKGEKKDGDYKAGREQQKGREQAKKRREEKKILAAEKQKQRKNAYKCHRKKK